MGLARYAHPARFSFGRRRKGWLYLFGAQLGFLMLHATMGWCPPVVVWRRLGVRTKPEIDVERALLLAALAPSLSAADGAGPLSVPQVAS